jgi:enamine deaminase RidA (YjgF/YER057c/UK114 family)
MAKQIIEVPVLSAAVRAMGVPLSLATKGGGLVFVSGMPPLDIATGKLVKGDIEVQAEASLVALKHALQAAGTTPDNVLMVRIYAANAGFYGAINRVYATHFPENPPARTFVPVASWPMEFDIEIECTALA